MVILIAIAVCVVAPIAVGMLVSGGHPACTAFDEPMLVCPCVQCCRGKK